MARLKGIIASSLTLATIGLAPTPAQAAVPAEEAVLIAEGEAARREILRLAGIRVMPATSVGTGSSFEPNQNYSIQWRWIPCNAHRQFNSSFDCCKTKKLRSGRFQRKLNFDCSVRGAPLPKTISRSKAHPVFSRLAPEGEHA
ncbi:hypothetical protein [Microvirga rosea]|uniref:hypothetical protein n=1 Tax=Microvirga rosea TaxID=2715425 RepID=UPI001D0B367F|nr:hypothetical protein [Microvirga rosea]MCB8823169.1 hypothetical protein [Microvirga rosea]